MIQLTTQFVRSCGSGAVGRLLTFLTFFAGRTALEDLLCTAKRVACASAETSSNLSNSSLRTRGSCPVAAADNVRPRLRDEAVIMAVDVADSARGGTSTCANTCRVVDETLGRGTTGA